MAGGRPESKINWETVETLCNMQCTQEEIASVVECDIKTLDKHCKITYGVSFSAFFKQKRKGGKASLRRSQWLTATDKGNPTMQIWLGKQYLDQKDKNEISNQEGKTFKLSYSTEETNEKTNTKKEV